MTTTTFPAVRLRSHVALLVPVILCVTVSAAAGQVPLTGKSRELVLKELVLPATADPTGSRASIEPVSSATIVTGADGTYGQFILGWNAGTKNYLHATLTAPATAGRVVHMLGDDLPSGTKVKFAYSRVFGLDT